jgi:hypothetical protein
MRRFFHTAAAALFAVACTADSPAVPTAPPRPTPPRATHLGGSGITHTLLTSGQNVTNTNVYTTASVAPAANKLITLAVMGHRSSGASPSPTVTGAGLTWTSFATVTCDPLTSSLKRITLYRALSASPGSGALTITFSAAQSHAQWIVSQWDGVDQGGTNGSGAIVQTGSDRRDNVTTLSVPLAAFASVDNAAYGVFGVKSGTAVVTPGAGFTEIAEAASNESPFSDLQAEWKLNDNTVDASWATAINACALAAELKAAAPPPAPAISPTLSTVTASPTSVQTGVGSTITVTVKDEAGAPVSGATVVLSATGTGNTLTQPSAPTDAAGVATGTLSSTAAGDKVVSATASGTAINQTATVTVTSPPPVPAAPSGLTATAVGSSRIDLAWTDNATDENGFRIERCQGAGCSGFAEIATVGANVASYGDTGLSASTLYRYRVRAYNANGNSAYSNVAEATTSAAPPPSTTVFYVSPTGSSTADGSIGNPWSLQHALSGAGGQVGPGDTVYIRGGTYPNGGSLTVSGSATGGHVVFSGYPGETPIIKQAFVGTGSYVVIQHLVFEGPIDGVTNQVYLHDNHHVVFTRNEIRFGNADAGLSVDDSNNYTITFNYIHDNGTDTQTHHGIYFKTTTGPGTVIAHNLLVNNAARGISLHDNNYPTSGGVFDVTVAHNTLVDNGSTGLLVNDGDRNIVVNNIAMNNGDARNQQQIRVLAGANNKIWNNLTWHSTATTRRGIENPNGNEATGNLIADPLFVSYFANLRLQSGSPAINAGKPGYTFGGKDYAGNLRDASPDIGAYEFIP